jgi:hypothetical protein
MRLAPLLLLLASATAMADPKDPKAGFASYKGARMLCNEHISGNTMHITWSSWATKDDIATVVAHYEKVIGAKATRGSEGEYKFSDGKDLRLSVYPADKNDSFPKCATKPDKTEKTIVLISNAAR